jgi:signal transduction histidine kinase
LNLKETVIHASNSIIFSDLDRKIIHINISDKKYVKANKKILTQIFINLIKNSLRATKGSENPNITISSEDIDKETFITVKDNGIGIDIKQKKKLFEPFYSLSSNGVGIGLAFCKLALKNMNCSITCESEINSYTSFIIKTKKYEA